jgi:DNA processing protein
VNALPVPQADLSTDVLVARAYLSRVAEAGSLAVTGFVARHGPIEAARLIRQGEVPDDVRSATSARARTSDGDDDLAAAVRYGIRFVVPESPDWPQFGFAPLYAAQQRRLAEWRAGVRTIRSGGEPTVPFGLWVRGPLPMTELAVRSAAVVGARAATPYGESVASEFGYGFARDDVPVVSGGAFGIDAAAHRGALAAGGPTVLVSAGGLDRPYPAAHHALYDEVGHTGLLVSENPPGCAPQRHRFLSRNRIIAALASVTVVVEAAGRSGALNTAAHCQALGRPLLAVPGPVTSALSAGCHALLSRPDDPAVLVTSTDDVLAFLGGGRAREDGEPGTDADIRPHDSLDPIAQAVLDGFPARSWIREEELARRSGVAAHEVMQALPVLRLNDLVESGRDGFRLIRVPR